VELHNFASNAVSQVAVFVAVCEGYFGVLAHWDLWRHLFWGELYTESVSAGVRKDLYIPCTMTTNNRDWDKACVGLLIWQVHQGYARW